MKFYRTTSVFTLSTWPEKGKAFIEIAPAIEGIGKGQPKAGEKRFNYDGAIRISFQTPDMLQVAYALLALAHGQEYTYKKFADMSKSKHTESNDKKSLTIMPGKPDRDGNGTVFIGLTQGDQKLNFNLSLPEVYAISKWFEFVAQNYTNNEILESAKGGFGASAGRDDD